MSDECKIPFKTPCIGFPSGELDDTILFDEANATYSKAITHTQHAPLSDFEKWNIYQHRLRYYQSTVKSKCLCIVVSVPCCKGKNTTLCCVATFHRATMQVLRKKAHELAGETFALIIPNEILLEIVKYVDVTSLRAWRRVDARIARLVSNPANSENWIKIRKNYFGHSNNEFYCMALQAAHDGHWNVYSLCFKKINGMHRKDIIAEYSRGLRCAAAMGGSMLIWDSLGALTIENNIALLAAACGHLDFVYTYFPLTEEMLQEAIYTWSDHNYDILDDIPEWRAQTLRAYPVIGETVRNSDYPIHPLEVMARRGHVYLIEWIVKTVVKNKWTQKHIPYILTLCAQYGHTTILDMFKSDCSHQIAYATALRSTTTKGLEWIHMNRPELFGNFIFTQDQFCTRSPFNIIQWLCKHRYIDIREIGFKIVDGQSSDRWLWLQEQYATLHESALPGWYKEYDCKNVSFETFDNVISVEIRHKRKAGLFY